MTGMGRCGGSCGARRGITIRRARGGSRRRTATATARTRAARTPRARGAVEGALPEAAAEVPTGEATSRLAVVNLDWDNLRAQDIMAVAASFAPGGAAC